HSLGHNVAALSQSFGGDCAQSRPLRPAHFLAVVSVAPSVSMVLGEKRIGRSPLSTIKAATGER
ncbi:MAG: hypothetical protein ACREV8_10580, partial [Gammaproteobacteria bacterium]